MTNNAIFGKTDRIACIDISKGIAIYSIMVIHLFNACSNDYIQKVNYLIRIIAIAVFFVVAGMTPSKKTMFTKIESSAKKLLLPFAIYITLSIVFCWFYGDYVFTVEKVFYYDGLLYFNEPLWFLIVLFEVELFEVIIKATTKNIYVEFLIVFFIIMFGYFSYTYRWEYAKWLNHFGINRAIVCYALFLCGNLLFKAKTIIKNSIFRNIILFFSVSCWGIISIINENVSMYTFSLGRSYWLFLISGVFGSIALLLLCT